MKESIISYFELNNSNVSEVFDSFDSRFIRFIFYKSIFTDFSGFEKVAFGLKGSVDDMYVARFIYTTFMSFSNFRSTAFLSGLDFENSNLKEQPNFLKTYINPKNTNRETFRIVKHSFDDAGNNIEANKFFVEEMKAYRRELRSEGCSWFSRLILFLNRWISNFGSNYMLPIGWLIASIFLFSEIIDWHSSFFIENKYFWNSSFDNLSIKANNFASSFLPLSRFLTGRSGVEFISLLFYILFAVLTWQIIVAVKRHTQR